MPSVNIPPASTAQSSFKFRFSDDPQNKVRRGRLVPLETPEVRASDKWYDYRNKKYYQMTKALESQLFWCISCSSQAEQALIFRNHSAWQVQKYCNSCVEKNIIKL